MSVPRAPEIRRPPPKEKTPATPKEGPPAEEGDVGVKDVIGPALAASEIDPRLRRRVLSLFAARGDTPTVFIKEAQEMRTQEGADPKTVALSLDLELGALGIRTASLSEQLIALRRKGKNSPAIEKRLREVNRQNESLQKERDEMVEKHPDTAENQITAFAKRLGISEDNAEATPLLAIQGRIQEAIVQKESRSGFFEAIRTAGVGEEDAEQFEKYVKHSAVEAVIKKNGKKGLVVAGGIGALMVMVAYFASKTARADQQRR